jgi:hypothetical protein
VERSFFLLLSLVRHSVTMSEASALGTLHANAKNRISSLVRLWTCFHCKLDHDTSAGKGVFCSSASSSSLTEGSLKDGVVLSAEIDKRLCHSAPKGYRERTHVARFHRNHEAVPLFTLWIRQIVRSELFYMKSTEMCGFSLFARRRVSFAEVCSSLVGWLCPDYDNLMLANHPSLFKNGRAHYILVGPLSLVNHHCGAMAGYGKPSKPRGRVDALAFVKDSGDLMMLQLADETDDDDHAGWAKDEEILIDYGPHAFGECKCARCFVPPPPPPQFVFLSNGSDDDTGSEPERKLIKL